MIWFGKVWHGTVWYGTGWYGDYVDEWIGEIGDLSISGQGGKEGIV